MANFASVSRVPDHLRPPIGLELAWDALGKRIFYHFADDLEGFECARNYRAEAIEVGGPATRRRLSLSAY
jgi:hypothetical protein